MAEDAIGIIFEVAGGENVNGATGRRIKKQLNSLAKNLALQTLNVKVTVDDSSIEDIKKKLDNLFEQYKGKIKIFADIGEKDGSKKNGSAAEDAKKEAVSYEAVKKQLEDINKLKAESAKLSAAKKATTGLDSVIKNLEEEYKKDSGKLTKDQQSELEAITKAQNKYRNALINVTEAKLKDVAATKSSVKTEEGQRVSAENMIAKVATLGDRFKDLIGTNKEAKEAYDNLIAAARQPLPDTKEAAQAQIRDLGKQISEVTTKFSEMDMKSGTVFGRLKKLVTTDIFNGFAAALTGLVTRALGQVYQNVLALDKAFVNLQIATGKTNIEVKSLMQSYVELGKQVGATALEVANAADVWLRQGYSINETNELIKNSLILSKLGKLDEAEATKNLTSAMKGYKVSVEDSLSIVDKLSAVDMKAAVSAGQMATAMSETAASANLAGISIDKLIGQIATVAEVTQDAPESVGTFFKTMYARMGNVKAGVDIDENGESLNDVEKSLKNVGVNLRDSKEDFRNFGDVLDEVAASWDRYTDVQKRQIATAFAGTRQQEKFIVLMQNYGNSLRYAEVSTNSLGTATDKFNRSYLNSIEAKINSLTAGFQGLSDSLLNSDLIKTLVDLLTIITDIISAVVNLGDGFVLNFGIAEVALISIVSLFKKLKAAILVAKAETISLKAVFDALGGWVTAFAIAISAVISIFKYASEKAVQTAEKARKAAEETRAIAEEEKKNLKTLDELIDRYKAIAKEEELSKESKQEAAQIQEDINKLIREEVDGLDLANKKRGDSLKILKELRAKEAEKAQSSLVANYYAAKKAADEAYTESKDGTLWGNLTTDAEILLKERDKEAEKILNKIEGVTSQYHSAGFTSSTIVNFEASTASEYLKLIEDSIKALNDDLTYDRSSELYAILNSMKGYYEEVVVLEKSAGKDLINNIVLIADATRAFDDTLADSIEYYDEYINELVEAAKKDKTLNEEIKNGKITQDDITEVVKEFMKLNYPKYWELIANGAHSAIVQLKDVLSILGDIENEFDALAASLKDIEDRGTLSLKSVKAILSEFPELMKYFEIIKDSDGGFIGYGLKEQYGDIGTYKILVEYFQEKTDEYVKEIDKLTKGTEEYQTAVENLQNFQIVAGTLLRSYEIENKTKEYNKQIKSLEEQADQYESIIELRKELLKTYKNEVSYQKELAKKQKNVADLATQASLAALDTSAAGQARARSLQEKLAEAQEALDEFTLEKATEELIAQLDEQNNEQQKFIKAQIDRINKAIEDLTKVTRDAAKEEQKEEESSGSSGSSSPSHPATGGVVTGGNGSTGNIPTYNPSNMGDKYGNTGGVAIGGGIIGRPDGVIDYNPNGASTGGGDSQLKYDYSIIDPAFRKYLEYDTGLFNSLANTTDLLNDSLVSIPQMINESVNGAVSTLAAEMPSNEINIEIGTLLNVEGNVDETSLPDLETIVDTAVNKMKTVFNDSLSRSGYRNKI